MKLNPVTCFCVASILSILSSGAPVAGVTCPPRGFDTVANFNLTQYIAAPWYIQQQMENSYQLEQDLYCVRAKYVPEDPEDFNKGIIVQNYRNRGGVNQNPGGSSGAGGGPCFGFDQIKAFPAFTQPTKPTDASKVLVGPAPLAVLGRALLGDYWVVAVGASDNETLGYDWAIVSAGAPNVSTPNGCRTGTPAMQFDPRVVNGVGLWLFSRKPVDPAGVQIMRAKAEELGFDLDVLSNVTQTGCTYTKADPVCDDSEELPEECSRALPGIGSAVLPTNLTGPLNLTVSIPGLNLTAGLPGNLTSRCFNGSAPGNTTVMPGIGNMTAPSGANSSSSHGSTVSVNWTFQVAFVLAGLIPIYVGLL